MKKHILIPSFILLSIALTGCLNNSISQKTTIKQNKTANQANTPKKVSFEKAQDIEWAEADQLYVFTNTPTQITITSKIKENVNLIPENVYLYRCDADGNPTENLGRMFDDGTHGDLSANDNRFTAQINFNEKEPKDFRFKVVIQNAQSTSQSEMVVIKIKKEMTYKEAREKIIADIEAGNIEDLQQKGIISERNKIFLMSLTDEKKEQFIKRAKEAKLIKEIGDMKIYRYSWIDDEGDENFVESWMGLNSKGDWTFQF